jgi:hypothetical protein
MAIVAEDLINVNSSKEPIPEQSGRTRDGGTRTTTTTTTTPTTTTTTTTTTTLVCCPPVPFKPNSYKNIEIHPWLPFTLWFVPPVPPEPDVVPQIIPQTPSPPQPCPPPTRITLVVDVLVLNPPRVDGKKEGLKH